MLGTVFIRFLRLQIISIICSLPIRLIEKGITESVTPVLALSFLLFSIVTIFDTVAFSKAYWRLRDILLGIFIPYILYLIFSLTGLFWIPSSIYNYLFLALRSPEIFLHKSLYSIITTHVFMLVVTIVCSVFSSRSSRHRFEIFSSEYDE